MVEVVRSSQILDMFCRHNQNDFANGLDVGYEGKKGVRMIARFLVDGRTEFPFAKTEGRQSSTLVGRIRNA